MFETVFKETLRQLSADTDLADRWWVEIEKAYNGRGRHYHNLAHLDNLLAQLLPIKDSIKDWPVLVLAIAWHDVIYNTRRSDNEEQSAVVATEKTSLLNMPGERRENVKQMILATKGHQVSTDSDVNFFTDADLSILGADNNLYLQYAAQIRKEYRFYPSFIYKGGRIKVLQHFLQMEHIYKTTWFRDRYEIQARLNMSAELASLGSQ